MFTKCYFLVECLQDQVVLFWSNGHIYITSIYILVPRSTCIVTFYHNMFAGTSPWHLFTPTSPWLLVGHWPFLLVTWSICWVCCWCDCQLQSVTGRTFSYRRGRVSGDWHWPSLSIYIQRVPQVYFDDKIIMMKTEKIFQGWFRVSGLLRHNELGQPWYFKQKEVSDI